MVDNMFLERDDNHVCGVVWLHLCVAVVVAFVMVAAAVAMKSFTCRFGPNSANTCSFSSAVSSLLGLLGFVLRPPLPPDTRFEAFILGATFLLIYLLNLS